MVPFNHLSDHQCQRYFFFWQTYFPSVPSFQTDDHPKSRCGDKLLHYWRFATEFTTVYLIKLAFEVVTVLGNKYIFRNEIHCRFLIDLLFYIY